MMMMNAADWELRIIIVVANAAVGGDCVLRRVRERETCQCPPTPPRPARAVCPAAQGDRRARHGM